MKPLEHDFRHVSIFLRTLSRHHLTSFILLLSKNLFHALDGCAEHQVRDLRVLLPVDERNHFVLGELGHFLGERGVFQNLIEFCGNGWRLKTAQPSGTPRWRDAP